jgi:hypothetical protein
MTEATPNALNTAYIPLPELKNAVGASVIN